MGDTSAKGSLIPEHLMKLAYNARLGLLVAGLLGFGLGSAGWNTASRAITTASPYAHAGNPALIVPLSGGHFLVTDFGNFDRTGAQVLLTGYGGRLLWRYSGYLDIPHSAYPMPNGNFLISDTGDDRVIEVNHASHIVWDTDNLGKGHGVLGEGTFSDGSRLKYPNDAKPLSNGNILISCRLQNRVIEITRQGKIVRSISGFLHEQHNPTPLPNGDIYIADSDADRVIEVNPQNKIVWQFGGQSNGSDILSWPRDAAPIGNGDTLITDSNHGRVIEVTRSKQIAHQWRGLSSPYAAVPLSNGDILVNDGSSYGFVEMNRQNKIVWRLNHAPVNQKNTTPPHVRNGSFEHTIPGSKSILKFWGREDALAYSLPPGKRADMVRDCHVFHTGRCSGRITYHGDSNGIYFNEIVRVTPGRRYRFTGWIKTKKVTTCYPCSYGTQGTHGHTAEFELALYGNAPMPSAPALPQHSGTTGWVRDSIEFTAPSGAGSLGIACQLRGQGTVWFDDVWVQQLK
jgi:hypothetical protein